MTVDMTGRVFLPHGGPLRLARFVRRSKRFLIDAEDAGGAFTAHANNTAANRQPTWSATKPNATGERSQSPHGLLNMAGPAQAGSDQHTPAAT